MREIIYRGKRVDNGEWVYGYFVNKVQMDTKTNIVFTPMIYDKEGWQWEVIPETIGQFIGLLDKNGIKIFEGDIVTAWSQGLQAVGRVQRRVDGLWILYPAHQKGKLWGMCPNQKGETTVEVIGNIHDNPELINE